MIGPHASRLDRADNALRAPILFIHSSFPARTFVSSILPRARRSYSLAPTVAKRSRGVTPSPRLCSTRFAKRSRGDPSTSGFLALALRSGERGEPSTSGFLALALHPGRPVSSAPLH